MEALAMDGQVERRTAVLVGVTERRRSGVPAGAAPPLREALRAAEAALAAAEGTLEDANARLARVKRRVALADEVAERMVGATGENAAFERLTSKVWCQYLRRV